MESFLNRYRNITVLLLVIFAQLVLLATQVRNDQDMRVIRVWTVSAVTPVARVVEALRDGGTGIFRDYFLLRNSKDENRVLRQQLDRLKLDNIFLRNELSTADRAKALQVFQAHTQSRTLAASVIGVGAGSSSKVVFVDRGTAEGVMRGMAVVSPDGILGKVVAAYPAASEVMLVNDPDFAAGVISADGQVRGTLKGQGSQLCKVDYVPAGDKVTVGQWFYTSGDDRIFPRGFPVGMVKSVRSGPPREILIEPRGPARGVEDVLIILSGVHQDIPSVPPDGQPMYIGMPAPDSAATSGSAAAQTAASPGVTDADKLYDKVKGLGTAQGHKFGEDSVGAKPLDFNSPPQPAPVPAAPGAQGSGSGTGVPNAAAPAAPATKPPAPAASKAAAPAVTTPAPKSPAASEVRR
jgi:rod shape-determining protein MreC